MILILEFHHTPMLQTYISHIFSLYTSILHCPDVYIIANGLYQKHSKEPVLLHHE